VGKTSSGVQFAGNFFVGSSRWCFTLGHDVTLGWLLS
jgi:hypothetical protein